MIYVHEHELLCFNAVYHGGGGVLEHGKKVKPVLSFFFSFSFYLLFCLLFCFQSERVMLFVKQVGYNPYPKKFMMLKFALHVQN